MKKRYNVRLTKTERKKLQAQVKKGSRAAYKIKHANILLAVDEDGKAWTDPQTAEAYGCHINTVYKVRRRFVERGLDGAMNRKTQNKPSRPRKLDGEGEAMLIAQACSTAPEGRSRWTLKLLAKRMVELEVVESISPQVIMETLKKMNISLI